MTKKFESNYSIWLEQRIWPFNETSQIQEVYLETWKILRNFEQLQGSVFKVLFLNHFGWFLAERWFSIPAQNAEVSPQRYAEKKDHFQKKISNQLTDSLLESVYTVVRSSAVW